MTPRSPESPSTFSSSARENSSDSEAAFLEDLRQAIAAYSPERAAAELTNWGGWWRNRFRENPAKARRILAELRSMIRERRIRRNPGAAAKDLWERLP